MAGHDHGPRQGYRFPVERRHVLKDEERKRRLPPEPMLDALDIQPGATVLDIGAGTGFWTVPLAKLVGQSGKVVAVDIEPVMIAELRAVLNSEKLENVEVVQSEELRIPLPDRIADVAVLGFVLHEPADPTAFLREVSRLLRPAGRILVADWQKWTTEQGPPVEHRLSEEEVRRMLQDEGFTIGRVTPPTRDVYILIGRRLTQSSEEET